jgi:hypothetical protein
MRKISTETSIRLIVTTIEALAMFASILMLEVYRNKSPTFGIDTMMPYLIAASIFSVIHVMAIIMIVNLFRMTESTTESKMD